MERKAKGRLASATKKLEDATREADRIVGRAGLSAKEERARQDKATTILADQERRERRIKERDNNINEREEELQKLMDDVAKSKHEATELKVSAEKLIAEAEVREERFRAVAAAVDRLN
jgi:hypothetical protein